jgi:hypothetical protein
VRDLRIVGATKLTNLIGERPAGVGDHDRLQPHRIAHTRLSIHRTGDRTWKPQEVELGGTEAVTAEAGLSKLLGKASHGNLVRCPARAGELAACGRQQVECVGLHPKEELAQNPVPLVV